MKHEDLIKFKKRYDALKQARSSVEGTWDLIERFIAPIRGGKFFQQQDSEHEVDWRRGREVFDSTAILAADMLSASIHGALTNPATEWFGFRFRSPALNEHKGALEWLEQATRAVHQAIGDSNFDLEISECYLDLVAFGSTVLFEEDVEGELEFSAIPLREAFYEQNAKQGAKTFYRRLQWSPVQIADKFGDKIPDRIKERLETNTDVDTREEVVMVIFERKDYAKGATIAAATRRQFGVVYFMHSDCALLGDEGGYYEMPVYVVRWKKASGSQWGFGPGTIALSNVLTLNRTIELTLKAAEKVLDPATLATERALLSQLDLSAGGLSIVRNVDGIRPYESGARFDVSGMQIEDLRASINRIFLVDQIQLKDSPMMTATEVQIRYEMMQRLLGPTLGRLQCDLLDPMLQRTFNIMFRSGKLPPPPEGISEQSMDIEYVGPLSRAQQTDRVASIERWMAQLGNMAAVLPGALDIPNTDEIARVTGRMLGVPPACINDAAQVKKARSEKQAMQDQAMQQQQFSDAAASMKNMAQGAAALGNTDLTQLMGQGGVM